MTKTRRIDDGRLHDNELHEVLGHLEDASLEQIGWLMREGHLTDPAGQPTGSHPIDDLPLVGDADPDAIHDTTYPVWTWDETHALVGTPDRLEIAPIHELPDDVRGTFPSIPIATRVLRDRPEGVSPMQAICHHLCEDEAGPELSQADAARVLGIDARNVWTHLDRYD